MSRRAVGAMLCMLVLIASGCGSRLTKQERAQVLGSLTGTASNSTDQTTGGQTVTGPAASSGPAGGSGGSSTSGTTTTGGGGGGQSGSGSTAAACAKATKATDTGVTPTKVTVATLADISGVQPGLFASAHQAARAAAAYINSTGGICGRSVEPLLLDSKTDSGGNRAAMLDACQKAFAVVGSMSAFDDGSAAPGQACGIPDMTAITTNAAKFNATNVYPINPNAGGYLGTSPPKYIAHTHAAAVKRAAILWLNQAVTKNSAVAREKAWKSVGFSFIYEAEVQVLEANYTRFVQDMRSKGVRYVTMVSDYQSIVRLQKSMRQQNFVPEVRDWDSVAYDKNFLEEPEIVNGSLVFLNTAMVEEASSNPEMQLYLQWLQRASPGAEPTYFGIYAWSAYRLFQKLATQIGPDLTRKKLFEALKATTDWGGNGMHAPHHIGAKRPSTCNLYTKVTNGKFVRLFPSSGFDCSGALYHVG